MTGRTSTENAVDMEASLEAGMRHETSAVEAIGRLEELAREAADLCAIVEATGEISWVTERDLPQLPKEDRAYIAALSPTVFLCLTEALRHSVEREAGLAGALEPFAKDCDRQERDWTFRDDDVVASRTAVTIGDLRKARAALDRRAGT